VRVGKILENSTDYSVQNTVRQALFLPTSREAKYKAKAAIIHSSHAQATSSPRVSWHVANWSGCDFRVRRRHVLLAVVWSPWRARLRAQIDSGRLARTDQTDQRRRRRADMSFTPNARSNHGRESYALQPVPARGAR